MAKQVAEAKTLEQKDAERAEKMKIEAKKRQDEKKKQEERDYLKQEIADMELHLKYYSYQMQLNEVYSKWSAWQKMLKANQQENVTTSETIKESEPQEETPIVEMKQE